MSRKSITQTIVQYFEDPKESNALAQIKRISNQAKNKSSKNLFNMKNSFDQNDFNTEVNTAFNQNLFKEDNKNKFQRRKFQFATQTFKPSIANEVKQRSNLKYWNILDDNDEAKDENNNKKQRLKLNEKHVNFTLNNKKEDKKYTHTTFNPNLIKRKEDSSQNNNNNLFKRRKSSFDDDSLISVQRIVRYLDDPKNSDALAEVKRISNQAKNKNKTSSNLVHINPNDIDNKESVIHNISCKPFKRRKFQFPTQVFKPKPKDLEIFQELKSNKNIKEKKDVNKNKKDENDSDALNSEADEDEDSEFDLDKKEKENDMKEEKKEFNEKKEIPQYNTRTYNIPYNRIKKDDDKIIVKEEKKPVIVNNMNNNINKGRNLILEKYKKIEPAKKEREKYSSSTLNVNETNKAINRKKDFVHRISYRFDTITDEYKKKNNLTVEKINTKEKIIKNEYSNKNPTKKHLKTYKTEYFWDKIINRLIEKRIYIDENDKEKEKEKEEPLSNNRSNKYSNNTFNPFNRYKKEFENKTKENNVTQEKIEFDSDKKVKRENNNKDNTGNTITDNINNNNDNDKKYVYSRKFKYLPHLYTANTFKPTKTVNINKESINTNNVNNNNDSSKPSYRIYQKRQIIPPKEDVKEKENNPKKNRTEILEKEDNNKYTKRTQEFKKKIIFTKKVKEPHIKSETTKKIEETKFKKVVMPYSSSNNNKKKNIRLNMFSGENDIFKESEQELKQRNKNNIYNNYLQNKKTTMNYVRHNRTNNNSELIDDLEKIEQYSINTYLKNDLLQIYDSINEEFKDFKKDVFNSNINNFENKMGNFDSNTFSIRNKYKFNVKDLCKGKTTTDDIYNKYKKRAINFGKDSYNKK